MNKKVAYIAMIWAIITSTQAQVDSRNVADFATAKKVDSRIFHNNAIFTPTNTMDCHDFAAAKSRNDGKIAFLEKVDSSNEAFLSSLQALRQQGVAKQGKAAASLVIHKENTQNLESTFENNAEQIQKTQKKDSSNEAMDCHATATQCLAMTENNAASEKVDSRKNAESVKTSQNENAQSVFDENAAGGRIFDTNAQTQKVDSRGNAKSVKTPQNENAQTISQPAKDSRICDEKCGLQGKSQGSYLSGSDRSDFPQLPHLSRKAESTNEQPTLDTNKLEFIISYKAQTHDGIITGERYSVADPITLKARTLKIAYTCSLNTPINDLITDDESYAIKYILTHYQEEVLECLRKGRASVRHDGLTSQNTRVLDSTTFAFPPQRILAHLDNRYLIIEVLKE